jgi:hypothetical protein
VRGRESARYTPDPFRMNMPYIPNDSSKDTKNDDDDGDERLAVPGPKVSVLQWHTANITHLTSQMCTCVMGEMVDFQTEDAVMSAGSQAAAVCESSGKMQVTR